MKNFEIDIQYVVSVTVHKEHKPVRCAGETTEDFLIRKLKSRPSFIVSTETKDHPEFAKLRNQLEDEGYIKTTRNCWNADTVLKPFTLNGVIFKKYNQFCCAAAMKYTLEHGNPTI